MYCTVYSIVHDTTMVKNKRMSPLASVWLIFNQERKKRGLNYAHMLLYIYMIVPVLTLLNGDIHELLARYRC
jgi:hypothetical protein